MTKDYSSFKMFSLICLFVCVLRDLVLLRVVLMKEVLLYSVWWWWWWLW